MTKLEMDYNQELARKLIHLSSLWIPCLYALVSKGVMSGTMLLATLAVIAFDIIRHIDPKVAAIVNPIFGSIMRSHERKPIGIYNGFLAGFSGATCLMLGSFVTILLFPKLIAITAIAILIVSDAAAAIVGRRFGKRYIGGKTLEGSIAFFITGYIVVIIIGIMAKQHFVFYFGCLPALIFTTFVELLAKNFKIDDNIAIPLTFSFVMFLLNA